MEREVTKWADLAREATINRDEAIREWREDGASFRTIARAAGLSIGAIQKILKRGKQ